MQAIVNPRVSKITLDSKFQALCSKTTFSSITKDAVSLLTLKCENGGKCQGNYTVHSGTVRRPIVKVVENSYSFGELNCEAVPKTDVINPDPANHDHKLVWSFGGFEISVIDEIKYDATKKRPVYAKETIRGESLYFKSEGDLVRPPFKRTPDITSNQMDPNVYPKKQQRDIFNAIDSSLESKIDCCHDKYLVHGHLVPNADFFYKSWRDATFYMTNVAPQWQSINAGNWLKVENAVRAYAKEKQKDMTVTTGIHGDLSIGGHVIELPGNIKVPSHFWKVLYDPHENAAVAFVIVNNPYADSPGGVPKASDMLCPSQCALLAKVKPSATKGLVMCCSPSELQRSIPEVPNYPTVPKNLFASVPMENALKNID